MPYAWNFPRWHKLHERFDGVAACIRRCIAAIDYPHHSTTPIFFAAENNSNILFHVEFSFVLIKWENGNEVIGKHWWNQWLWNLVLFWLFFSVFFSSILTCVWDWLFKVRALELTKNLYIQASIYYFSTRLQ